MSNGETNNAWVFLAPKQEKEKKLLHESIKSGKSRFGWSTDDECNLKLEDNWWRSTQRSLLKIKEGDWIVHINVPEWGKCVAVKVCSEYGFDDGLPTSWGVDFRHCFTIDTNSITEFERRDSRILPSVNLCPRRGEVPQRIYAVDDFHKSRENLKSKKQIDHLKNKLEQLLPEISHYIHEMNRGKKLEGFMAEVFRKILTVVEVKETGSGWGTDHGTDLIVETATSLGPLVIENTIIVQVKSYSGTHTKLDAVDQIKIGIEKYKGTAGMIITTAKKSEELENKVQEASDKLDMEIALLDARDVARLTIRHAPELLFNLNF